MTLLCSCRTFSLKMKRFDKNSFSSQGAEEEIANVCGLKKKVFNLAIIRI